METKMTPKRKPNWANTYHRDGTISYWSVYEQRWQRTPDRELAAMDHTERKRAIRHLEHTDP